MNRIEWMLPTSNSEAYRRAGGRRRYNSERSAAPARRRMALIELIKDGVSNAKIARMFGVHRSQITRDIRGNLLLTFLDNRKLNRILAKMDAKKPRRKRSNIRDRLYKTL